MTAAPRRELTSDAAANSRQSAGRRAVAPEPKEGQSRFSFAHRLGRVCRHRGGKVAPRVDHAGAQPPTPALTLPLTGAVDAPRPRPPTRERQPEGDRPRG